ncbi:MAG: FtsQ-type POTRA domain-containing protein [Patescibacteria group bacterium]|jgi:cell division septal protein FtsQ
MFRNKLKLKRSRGFRKREIKVVNKPVYENPYFKKKKQQSSVLRLIARPKVIALSLVVGGLIYFFFYSAYFTIRVIDVTGNQELTYDTVRFEVNKSFIERRFLIFKQSNLFMYDIDEAKQKLWDAFVLDEITITKRFPNKLIVRLKEKIPNLTLITEKAFYYMDLQGVVTHFVPEAEIKQYFPKIEDLNKRTIKLKDQIISEELVNAVIIIRDSFKNKTNVDIDRFLIPETTCGTLDSKDDDDDLNGNINSSNNNINRATANTNRSNQNVNRSDTGNSNVNGSVECNLVQAVQDIAVLTTEGWKAYFTVNDDIATQLERLKIYLQKKTPDQASRENIDYIDLRFGEKVYVME